MGLDIPFDGTEPPLIDHALHGFGGQPYMVAISKPTLLLLVEARRETRCLTHMGKCSRCTGWSAQRVIEIYV